MLSIISILMMRMRKMLIRLEKITVHDVKGKQDFRLEGEVNEDSMEQSNPNNSHVTKMDIMPNM
jgi:hypothetical protein